MTREFKPRRDFRNRLKYSDVLFHLWWICTVASLSASVFCLVFGQFTWALGWFIGAVALSAHARLEHLDGHTHNNSNVEVP